MTKRITLPFGVSPEESPAVAASIAFINFMADNPDCDIYARCWSAVESALDLNNAREIYPIENVLISPTIVEGDLKRITVSDDDWSIVLRPEDDETVSFETAGLAVVLFPEFVRRMETAREIGFAGARGLSLIP